VSNKQSVCTFLPLGVAYETFFNLLFFLNVSYFGYLLIINGRIWLLRVPEWCNRGGKYTTKFDILPQIMKRYEVIWHM
jgi:hypothetical protein